MVLHIDARRGRQAAERLYRAFRHKGVFGHMEDMPETLVWGQRSRGTRKHLLFLTFTVAVDRMRDGAALWQNAARAARDPDGRRLFDPQYVSTCDLDALTIELERFSLPRYGDGDVRAWQTLARTLCRRWDGDPRAFLADCDWDAAVALKRLKKDKRRENGKWVRDFPLLRDDKISPLWIRMLRDNAGLTDIKNLDRVPIPVDVHVARATLALGVVRGTYRGPEKDVFRAIRQACFESVPGLSVKGRAMTALDVDTPLWTLSRYGCRDRDVTTGACRHSGTCPVADLCAPGVVCGRQGQPAGGSEDVI